jgi:AcrR family transcriptional regulator
MTQTSDGRTRRWANRRTELLHAVMDCMCREGLADQSVRGIARQIGVSAPTLLHHFASKEELLAEALAELQREEIATLAGAFDHTGITDGLRSLWQIHMTHGSRDQLRASFEFQAIALRNPERFPSYHQNVTRPWVEVLHKALERSGCPDDQRIAMATLLAGAYRGLLTDLLATGESQRIGRGFDALMRVVRDAEISWRHTRL